MVWRENFNPDACVWIRWIIKGTRKLCLSEHHFQFFPSLFSVTLLSVSVLCLGEVWDCAWSKVRKGKQSSVTSGMEQNSHEISVCAVMERGGLYTLIGLIESSCLPVSKDTHQKCFYKNLSYQKCFYKLKSCCQWNECFPSYYSLCPPCQCSEYYWTI